MMIKFNLLTLTIAVLIVVGSCLAAYYFSWALASQTTSGIPGVSSPIYSNSLVVSLGGKIENNPRFLAEENGTSYVLRAHAGFVIQYYNGTDLTGNLLLIYDHYNGTYSVTLCNGTTMQLPIIESEIQVVTDTSGSILQITYSSSPMLNTFDQSACPL